jgi:hypothetical protein
MDKDRKVKTIRWEIKLPMEFPNDWDDEMIEFHLNESSWCCSNLINLLSEYDKENGCICSICKAEVDLDDQTNKSECPYEDEIKKNKVLLFIKNILSSLLQNF